MKCVDNRNDIHFKSNFALKTGNVSGGFHRRSLPNFRVKFNSFYANVTFRYPLKPSEKLRYRFHGVYKWNTNVNYIKITEPQESSVAVSLMHI